VPCDLEDLWNIEDIAERYDLNPKTVERLVRAGEVRGFKLGRRWKVPAVEWNAYIARRLADADDESPGRDPRRPADHVRGVTS